MLAALFYVADKKGLTIGQLFETGLTAVEFLHWVEFYRMREGD